MKQHHGFTLIELLVTISIMVILMTLAVANIRSSQVRARDSERVTDATSLGRQLDSLYVRGFPAPISSLRGAYPTTNTMNDAATQAAIFAGLPEGLRIDPGKDTTSESIKMATSNKSGLDANPPNNTTAVTPFPGSDYPYVYQPLNAAGNLCQTSADEPCTRFNLYYMIERQYKMAGVVQSERR